MTSFSLTAASPPQGAEGDLHKYAASLGMMSALPFLIPLHAFRDSFPRDRVDTAKLKELPPLRLSALIEKEGNWLLPLSEDITGPAPEYLRGIHGKPVPETMDFLLPDWKGMLMIPAGLSVQPADIESAPLFHYASWQLGLYRIRFDEKRRFWWEDFTFRPLWKVRKAKG